MPKAFPNPPHSRLMQPLCPFPVTTQQYKLLHSFTSLSMIFKQHTFHPDLPLDVLVTMFACATPALVEVATILCSDSSLIQHKHLVILCQISLLIDCLPPSAHGPETATWSQIPLTGTHDFRWSDIHFPDMDSFLVCAHFF